MMAYTELKVYTTILPLSGSFLSSAFSYVNPYYIFIIIFILRADEVKFVSEACLFMKYSFIVIFRTKSK